MTERIRWEKGHSASQYGYVGSLDSEAFLIFWADGWALTSRLPGLDVERSYAATPEALKAEAEKLLAEFTASLGAIFPDEVSGFQVHADEEGDLRLLCPRAEDLGCLFAAEVLSGSTIAQITEKARAHTGEEADSAHDFIRTINGEDVAGTPAPGEADQ